MHYLTLSIILFFNPYGANKKTQTFPFMDLPENIQELIIAEAISNNPQTAFKLSQVSKDIQKLTNAEVERNAPLKALHDLTKNRDRWIASARQAGIDGIESNHLLEILEIEKILFAQFLIQKERTIGSNQFKWKKHALTILFSYSAAKYTAWDATYYTAWDATWGAIWNTAKHVAWNETKNAAFDSAWNVLRSANWNTIDRSTSLAVGNTDRNAALRAVREAARAAARNAGDYSDSYVTSDNALTATKHAAKHAALDATKHAVLDSAEKAGRIAYRVAETQAWIKMLDPKLKTFEKAYNSAYSQLDDISEEQLVRWFSSKQNFERKLNQYFVNRQGLSDRSKEFLKHIKDHLNRMIPKIFPSDKIEAAVEV